MNYNANATTEKTLAECPRQCSDCQYHAQGDTCSANNIMSHAYGFENPQDRCLPMALNCYWWYANHVWTKVPENKQRGYAEERKHMFLYEQLKTIVEDKRALTNHYFRPGGGKLIDFSVYPQAKPLYSNLPK